MKPIQISRLVKVLVLLVSFFTPAASFAQPPTTAAAYPFVTATGTYTYLSGGTSVAIAGDEQYVCGIPIGFSFPFCGATYTTLCASSNGWISFGSPTAASLTNSLSSYPAVAPGIFPLWDDLDGASGSASYLVTGTAPNRVFTLEWRSYEWYWLATSPGVSFQVKLYESGLIECWYQEESGALSSPSATIGIAKTPTDYQTLPNTSANPIPSSTTFTTNLATKPATGQVYIWGQLPCTGVPSTSVAGPAEVCPNKPFTLTLSGLSTYSGLTFQWQASTNGTTWTNYAGSGGTSLSMIDAIAVPKWYRATVVCTNSGQTFTTAPKYVGISPFYYCYCESSKALNAAGTDIGNMTIQAESNGAVKLNNGSAVPVINNTNSTRVYSDFRYALPAVPVYRDSSYVFTVSQINSAAFNSAMAAVYVDYNRNGRFDTSERVLIQATANTLPTPGVVNDTFRIPDTAGIGLTGMRVILRTGTVDPDTCIAYTDGETEDYLLDIRYEPCTGSVNPGVVAATDTSVCVGYRYSIADTTHERKKSDINWWWQYSPDGRIWANLPNSANKDTFNNIMFSNTIYYRVGTVCLNTMDTTYSAAQRIGQKAAYKCYCYSLADGSENYNSIDSSDIGAVGIGSMLFTSSGPHMGNESAVRSRTDYTDMVPVALETERRYRLLVYHTMNRYDHADAKVTVFMDFNNNKQYDIPQERVGTWFTSINNHTIIDSVYIPDSTIVNVPTGMRVILNNNVAPNIQSDFACGTYTSGETEDFIVMFKRPIVTGVQTLNGISNLGLYPNPTSGKFRIQFDGAAKDLKVMVSTVTGQQIEQRAYNHRGGLFNEELDMSSHAKGVYFVELQADGEKMTRKLVVQ